MTCPNDRCGRDVPDEPLVGPLTICPSCLASLVLEGYHYRRAVAEDTTTLSEADLGTLRKARKKYREAA